MARIEGTQLSSFADAQDDNWVPIRLFLSDELVVQFVGINDREGSPGLFQLQYLTDVKYRLPIDLPIT